MAKTIGERLKEIRLDARLTQRDLAKIVGLTPGSIGAMENNLYTPNFDVLRIIHSKLNVSYEYIIDGVKIDHPTKLIAENKELREEVERLRKVVDKLCARI
jgi:transcriptional regulator with XRE-family HTH domain